MGKCSRQKNGNNWYSKYRKRNQHQHPTPFPPYTHTHTLTMAKTFSIMRNFVIFLLGCSLACIWHTSRYWNGRMRNAINCHEFQFELFHSRTLFTFMKEENYFVVSQRAEQKDSFSFNPFMLRVVSILCTLKIETVGRKEGVPVELGIGTFCGCFWRDFRLKCSSIF